MEAEKSLHLFIDGHVQGVGFRWFTQETASALGLTGYVRNLMDGRVEAYAEGSEKALLQFLHRVQEGPGYGRVTEVLETWGVASGQYRSFRITR